MDSPFRLGSNGSASAGIYDRASRLLAIYECLFSALRANSLFSVEQYARKMLQESAWGGGIELVCFSRSRRMNVHVYRVGQCVLRKITPKYDIVVHSRCAHSVAVSKEYLCSTLMVLNILSVLSYGMVTITMSCVSRTGLEI